MSGFHTIMILLTTFVAVFLESAMDVTRHLLGAQISLLPPLVVYAALTSNLTTVVLVSILGGLGIDSLSANPLGVTLLPLFLVGYIIHLQRELILHRQYAAQFAVGACASAIVPLLTVLILLSSGRHPLISWASLWQWFLMTVGGGLLTPVLFHLFRAIRRHLTYQPVVESSFRLDREIRRGRR